MKFEKGNKLAKGGRRNPPGGRPSTRELKEIARAADKAREKLQQKFVAITDCYTDLATDREHEATTRHAMENYVLPVEKEGAPPTTIVTTFLQFGNNHDSAQRECMPFTKENARRLLPAEELPAPVLGNGNGDEACRHGAPPALRFHNFADPGKRRK